MAIVVDRIDSGPPYHSNCYLVRGGDRAGEAVAIDPGGSAGDVLAALADMRATLAAVLVTHADVDHVAAVAELCAQTGVEAWVPSGEAEMLASGRTRGDFTVAPHAPEHGVADGDRLALAGLEFEVVGVPGHSIDHVAFAADSSLFAGDLLFAGSVGRTELSGGDSVALLGSIRKLFNRLGPETVVYPGHGEPTTLGAEQASNPYLGSLRER